MVSYGRRFEWYRWPGEPPEGFEVSGCETAEQATRALVRWVLDSGYHAPKWWQWWRWREKRLPAQP